jgi:hypothetical protein
LTKKEVTTGREIGQASVQVSAVMRESHESDDSCAEMECRKCSSCSSPPNKPLYIMCVFLST